MQERYSKEEAEAEAPLIQHLAEEMATNPSRPSNKDYTIADKSVTEALKKFFNKTEIPTVEEEAMEKRNKTVYWSQSEKRYEGEFTHEQVFEAIKDLEGFNSVDSLFVLQISKDKNGKEVCVVVSVDSDEAHEKFAQYAYYFFVLPSVDVGDGEEFTDVPVIIRMLQQKMKNADENFETWMKGGEQTVLAEFKDGAWHKIE